MSNPVRKRTHRRPVPVSAKAIRQRFREIWSDGFSFPIGIRSAAQIEALREAMRELAADDDYWRKLEQMTNLNRQVNQIREELRK